MKKTISLMLVAMLLIACMTVTAFAAKAGETVTVTLTATGSEPFTDFSGSISFPDGLSITGTAINGYGYLNGTKLNWAATNDVTSASVFNLQVTISPNAEHKTYTISGASSSAYNQAAEPAGTVSLYAQVTVDCDYTFKTETVEATCTTGGYTRHYCECGKYIDDALTPATGHNWGEWTVTKEATCTEAGSQTRTCLNGCGESQTQDIPATGHDHVLTDSTTGENCKTPGVDTYTCSCGDSYTVANQKFGPHSYVDGEYEKNETHHWTKCSLCGHETEKHPHDFCIDLNDKWGCICGATKDKPSTPTSGPTNPTDPEGGNKTGDITPYPVFFVMAAALIGTAYGFKRKFVK